MENQPWSTVQSKSIERFLIAGVAAIILVHMFFIISYEHIPKVTAAYLLPLVTAMITLVWIRKGRPKGFDTVLFAAFILWYVLTRLINGDKYFSGSLTYIVMISLGCLTLYPMPTVLSEIGRLRFMDTVALLYSAVIGLVAWAGIFSIVSGILIANPFNEFLLGPDKDLLMRLRFFTTHPNGFSCLMYIALTLVFYLTVKSKRIVPRIWYGFLATGLCLGIYFTRSTTGIVVTGLLWIVLGCLVIVNSKKVTWKRVLIVSAVILLIVAAILAGTVLMQNAAQERYSENATQASFNTRFDQAAGTFSSRMAIWETAIKALQQRPIGLLFGEQRESAMARIFAMYGNYEFHMHNSFVEILVECGVIGLLIAIALSVFVIIQCVQLMFCQQAPLASKILVLPLIGLFMHAMTENYIFTFDELPNLFFFLIAGMVVFESRKWCSAKRTEQSSAA